MFMPMYGNATGQFLGVKETMGYIMLQNEPEETFLSYGFSSEHSNKLLCFPKQPMPNIFRGTNFNSHKLQTFEIILNIFEISRQRKQLLCYCHKFDGIATYSVIEFPVCSVCQICKLLPFWFQERSEVSY